MKEETKEWFDQALSEFESAKDLINTNKFSQASFHAHQAVEYALKALHIEKKKPILGHDVVYLARKLNAPETILKKCDLLNPAYEDARYVDRAEKAPSKLYTEDIAKEHINSAEEVLNWIKKKLDL